MLKIKIAKIICALFLILTFQATFTSSVFAHILKTDDQIGAVMHMDPDDDPIVGKPTELMFQIKDKTNKFDATQCFCTISISQEEQPQQRILHSKISDQIHYTHTFNQKGIYKIIVKGEPLQENKFQKFELEYQIRVDKEELKHSPVSSNDKLTTDQKIPFLIIIFIVIFVTILISKTQPVINKKSLTLVLLFSLLNLSVLSSFKYLDCDDHSDSSHHSTNSLSKHPCCLPLLPIQNPSIKIAENIEKKVTYKITPDTIYISHLRPTLRDKSPPKQIS